MLITYSILAFILSVQLPNINTSQSKEKIHKETKLEELPSSLEAGKRTESPIETRRKEVNRLAGNLTNRKIFENYTIKPWILRYARYVLIGLRDYLYNIENICLQNASNQRDSNSTPTALSAGASPFSLETNFSTSLPNSFTTEANKLIDLNSTPTDPHDGASSLSLTTISSTSLPNSFIMEANKLKDSNSTPTALSDIFSTLLPNSFTTEVYKGRHSNQWKSFFDQCHDKEFTPIKNKVQAAWDRGVFSEQIDVLMLLTETAGRSHLKGQWYKHQDFSKETLLLTLKVHTTFDNNFLTFIGVLHDIVADFYEGRRIALNSTASTQS